MLGRCYNSSDGNNCCISGAPLSVSFLSVHLRFGAGCTPWCSVDVAVVVPLASFYVEVEAMLAQSVSTLLAKCFVEKNWEGHH